jgi:hypothetical protein
MGLQNLLDSAKPISGYDCVTRADLIESYFDPEEEVVQILHGRATWDGRGPKTSLIALTDLRVVVIFTEMGRPNEKFEISHSEIMEIQLKIVWNSFDSLTLSDLQGNVRLTVKDCDEKESQELANSFTNNYSDYEKNKEVRAKEKAKKAKEIADQLQKEQAMAREQISSHLEGNLNDAIEAGKTLYHYRWLYLEIDSEINGDPVGSFNFDAIQDAGIEGWKVLGILPRTVGVGLKNTSTGSTFGQSWGGGIGGIVAGAYIILGREVDRSDSSWLSELKNEFMGRLGAL